MILAVLITYTKHGVIWRERWTAGGLCKRHTCGIPRANRIVGRQLPGNTGFHLKSVLVQQPKGLHVYSEVGFNELPPY